MLRKTTFLLLLTIAVLYGTWLLISHKPALLVFMIILPCLVVYSRQRPQWLNGRRLRALWVLRIVNLFCGIVLFFNLSKYQTYIAAQLFVGKVSTSIAETRRAFHPVTSETVYLFTAADPADQKYVEAIFYLLIALIIAAVLSMFAGLAPPRMHRRS